MRKWGGKAKNEEEVTKLIKENMNINTLKKQKIPYLLEEKDDIMYYGAQFIGLAPILDIIFENFNPGWDD